MNTEPRLPETRPSLTTAPLPWLLASVLIALLHSAPADSARSPTPPATINGSDYVVGDRTRIIITGPTTGIGLGARIDLDACINGYSYKYRGRIPSVPPGENWDWNESTSSVQRVLNQMTLSQLSGGVRCGALGPETIVAYQYPRPDGNMSYALYTQLEGSVTPPPVSCSVTTQPLVNLGTITLSDLPSARINLDSRVVCTRQAVVTASFSSLTGGQAVSFGGAVTGRLTLGAGDSNTSTVIAQPGVGTDLQSAISLSPAGGAPGTYQAVGVLNVTVH